jgi:hypothetical protein
MYTTGMGDAWGSEHTCGELDSDGATLVIQRMTVNNHNTSAEETKHVEGKRKIE